MQHKSIFAGPRPSADEGQKTTVKITVGFRIPDKGDNKLETKETKEDSTVYPELSVDTPDPVVVAGGRYVQVRGIQVPPEEAQRGQFQAVQIQQPAPQARPNNFPGILQRNLNANNNNNVDSEMTYQEMRRRTNGN